jgi:hypothetical protein
MTSYPLRRCERGMIYAAGAILIVAGGIALAVWVEDPFIKREATLQRMLTRHCPLSDKCS